jgi:hypothetical protein
VGRLRRTSRRGYYSNETMSTTGRFCSARHLRPFGSLALPRRSPPLKNFRGHWTNLPAMCLLGVELLTVEVSPPMQPRSAHGRLPVVPSDMP